MCDGVVGCCGYENNTADSVEKATFFGQLSYNQLLIWRLSVVNRRWCGRDLFWADLRRGLNCGRVVQHAALSQCGVFLALCSWLSGDTCQLRWLKKSNDREIMIFSMRRNSLFKDTRPGVHKSRATKFCKLAPNIYGFSDCDLRNIILSAPRILRWLLEFWRICVPLH